MAQAKTLVKALRPFAHGNVDAKQDGVYAMNKGDAQELVKAGFAEAVTSGEAEQTQIDHPPQAKQVGDVAVDDAEDLLGGEKMAAAPENKMAKSTTKK